VCCSAESGRTSQIVDGRRFVVVAAGYWIRTGTREVSTHASPSAA
jgi:hypothetical protein